MAEFGAAARKKWAALACALACAAAAAAGEEPRPVQESDAARATRLGLASLSAAANAQAAGLASDPASLARMGALPAAAMKWGQLRNPWRSGQFLDVALRGAGKSAQVGIMAPSIPKGLCMESIAEISMDPGLDRLEVGARSFKAGSAWKIEDPDALCAAMEAGPVGLWAKAPPPAPIPR